MAQQDTGLGWSAKDNWLVSAGNYTLANITGTATHIPVPSTTSLIAESESPEHTIHNYIYAGVVSGSSPVYMVWYEMQNQSLGTTPVFYSASPFVVSYYAGQSPSGGPALNYTSRSALNGTMHLAFYAGYAGPFAYHGWTFNPPAVPVSGPVLSESPTQEMLDSYAEAIIAGSSTTIIKDNLGYAVACLCEWITPDGVIQKSPVLISTDETYVNMSLEGHTQYKNIRQYSGLTFYMTLFLNLDGDFTSSLPAANLTQFGAAAPSKVFALIAAESFANILVTSAPDPYELDGGESEEGGSDGEDDDADDIDFTDTPSTAIGATGFLTIFCPSLGQLQNLANYMWTTFDPDNWRKVIANPMDAILGLNIIPVPPHVTGTKTVSVAGVSTEIMMDYTSLRYVKRPMGSCYIPKKWGSYLDYNPYTKCSIFLPYIGFQELNVDDIMGQTINLQYIIDILTGACVAELKCGDSVLYSWTGNCANPVPIASASWNSAISSALSIAATVAGLALTGGASSAMIPGAIASVGANSMNLKPTVNRSGSIGGSSGFIAGQRPYIIRTLPNLVIPADQNKFIGYPSFVTMPLGSLTGYNEIASIHLEGIPATGNELAEIESLLKGGVIF